MASSVSARAGHLGAFSYSAATASKRAASPAAKDGKINRAQALELERARVALASVNIEKVAPPAEAADAFRDVAGARADAVRIVNQAQGYANDLVPRARGAADQVGASAQAYDALQM
jgi:regulator of protease activity HflC (stomatin/prohibitin superfamily)